MPHQCLGCDRIYDNSSDVIIKGCPNCNRKLFLYLKDTPKEEEQIEISKRNKELILEELESMTEIQNIDEPIVLKLENVRVLASGKYEIDINQLMKKEKPLIYKIQDGTYVIDLNFLVNKDE